jgi:hypothetical protein
MAPTGDPFPQAANHWDLDTLYADLATAKGKPLTPTEKLHLRGLLCGCSPSKIAQTLGKNCKGVETDLCATLYRYVKSLVGKGSEKIYSWRNITSWLEEAGYTSPPAPKSASAKPFNEKFNITNINCENNQITIEVFLQITIPVPSEFLRKNPDKGEDNSPNGMEQN